MRFFILILSFSCANLTESGAKVGFIETPAQGIDLMNYSEKVSAKYNCSFKGFVDADTSLFPGSYSIHQNEVHAALRNRAAKIGANVVIANFYIKSARGIGLICPDTFAQSD